MKFDTGFDNSKVKRLIMPNIAAVSRSEAAFSYGAEKSGIIKIKRKMDRRKIQMAMVTESMNDDFSRHLCAAISSLVRETVQVAIAEMEEQGLAAKRENPMLQAHPQEQEYMTRKEVMTLLKRCDSTMTKWAKRGYLVPCSVGGKYLYRKSDVMKLVGK